MTVTMTWVSNNGAGRRAAGRIVIGAAGFAATLDRYIGGWRAVSAPLRAVR